MDARYRRHPLCRQQLPGGVSVPRILVLEAGSYVGRVGINIIFARLFDNTRRRLIVVILVTRPNVFAC
jgi:hypothetical protein